jgi:NAD(P)-dependent dehydrogenase (short-subunit alcohol dehydrogenase family)
MSQRLKDRICLVTGASRGIGHAVAKAFAAEGAQVIALARTQGGLAALDDAIKAAGGLPPVLVPCDLTKYDAIDELGAKLFERFGRLDVLVGNAGSLGVLGPVAQSDAKKFTQTVELNLIANYRLIRSMDPLLRASPAGRVIFVTSGVTRGVVPFWGAYAVSKVALEHLAQLYAAETGTTGIKVNLLDPGAVRTAMRAAAFPGEDPAMLPAPDAITETFIEMAVADSLVPSGGRVRALAVESAKN